MLGYAIEALRSKPEGRCFDYRWGQWIFYLIYCLFYCPGFYSASNISEYQEYFLGGGGKAMLPISFADILEILVLLTSCST